MSSFTVAGKLRKSRLADPTQCNGFSSAAGTRRTQRLSLFWDTQASQRTLALGESAAYVGPGNGPQHSGFEFGDAAVDLARPRGFGVLVHLGVETLQQRPGEGCPGLGRECERVLQNLGGVAVS